MFQIDTFLIIEICVICFYDPLLIVPFLILAIKSSPARKRLTFRESKRPNEETPTTVQNTTDREQLRSQMSPLQDSHFKAKLNSFKAIDSVDSVSNMLNKSDSKRALNKFTRNIEEEENDNDYSIHHNTDYNSIKSSASLSRPMSDRITNQTDTKSVTSIIRHPLPHELSPSKSKDVSDHILSTQAIQIKVHSPSKLNSFDTNGYMIKKSEVATRKNEQLQANMGTSNIQIQYPDHADKVQHYSPSFNGKSF